MEGFYTCIVIRISFSAECVPYSQLFKAVFKFLTGILASEITVQDYSPGIRNI